MDKADYRKKYLELRNNLSEAQVRDMSEKIFHQLSKTDIWEYAYYMLFYPIADKKEVDLRRMATQLWSLGKRVYLPKLNGNDMQAALYTDETVLQQDSLGVMEPADDIVISPEKIEVFIIPMAICDRSGNRIGYGKGFYDRYLQNASPTCLKVGVNFFAPLEENIPDEDHDIKLDYCFTPDSIVSFGTSS